MSWFKKIFGGSWEKTKVERTKVFTQKDFENVILQVHIPDFKRFVRFPSIEETLLDFNQRPVKET